MWHAAIVHRLLDNGPLGFNALKTDVDGISSEAHSDVSEDPEEKRLVDGAIVSEIPVAEYSLTDLGESLAPIILEMAAWGVTNASRNRSIRHRRSVRPHRSRDRTPPVGRHSNGCEPYCGA